MSRTLIPGSALITGDHGGVGVHYAQCIAGRGHALPSLTRNPLTDQLIAPNESALMRPSYATAPGFDPSGDPRSLVATQ
jgi:hypothetical protein